MTSLFVSKVGTSQRPRESPRSKQAIYKPQDTKLGKKWDIVISIEGALRRQMTYDDHPTIRSIHSYFFELRISNKFTLLLAPTSATITLWYAEKMAPQVLFSYPSR